MQRILFFTAAALFLTAAGLRTMNDGMSLTNSLGLMTAAIMAWLGLKSKGASAER